MSNLLLLATEVPVLGTIAVYDDGTAGTSDGTLLTGQELNSLAVAVTAAHAASLNHGRRTLHRNIHQTNELATIGDTYA